uniref:Uncharacterized protein n=1 Tax=Cucumis melo TaxID=3656 RepID=A0A9I9DWV8_CUCME
MGKSDLTKARFMKLGLESCRGSDEKQCEEKQFEDYPMMLIEAILTVAVN